MQELFGKIIEKLEEIRVKPTCNKEKCDTKELCRICVVDDAIEIVKQEAEKYNNGWIPCSERLPEPIRPVLVTLRNCMNDKCFVRVRRFHTDHWNTDEGIVENSVVIAWQPFPQPYEPKGE